MAEVRCGLEDLDGSCSLYNRSIEILIKHRGLHCIEVTETLKRASAALSEKMEANPMGKLLRFAVSQAPEPRIPNHLLGKRTNHWPGLSVSPSQIPKLNPSDVIEIE